MNTMNKNEASASPSPEADRIEAARCGARVVATPACEWQLAPYGYGRSEKIWKNRWLRLDIRLQDYLTDTQQGGEDALSYLPARAGVSRAVMRWIGGTGALQARYLSPTRAIRWLLDVIDSSLYTLALLFRGALAYLLRVLMRALMSGIGTASPDIEKGPADGNTKGVL